jgi:hypothetical protein
VKRKIPEGRDRWERIFDVDLASSCQTFHFVIIKDFYNKRAVAALAFFPRSPESTAASGEISPFHPTGGAESSFPQLSIPLISLQTRGPNPTS